MNNTSDFVIENGVLKAYKGRAKNVEIPEGIKSIGTAAFRGRRSLVNISIPDTVTRIGDSAFVGCNGLKSLEIPESVTRIDNRAFALCKGLTGITIPPNVNIMGNEICSDCEGLTSVTILCKTVGKDAFCNCGELKIFLPNGLQYAESAFSKCNCELHLWRWSPETTKLMKDAQIKTIYVEDFLSIPQSYRLQTALGLVKDVNFDWDSDCGKDCLDYLAKSAKKTCKTAFDHSALLDFLVARRLIEAKDLDAYLEEAEQRGDAESKALLLNYQNTLGEAVSKARQKKEKVKEKYADALVARIAARDTSKGIEGMTFVITGKLSNVWESRKEVQAYLESYGANLGSSITKKTDYLVTNDTDSGSEKNRKAKELGALVISEAEFNDMIGKRFADAPKIVVPAWIKAIPDHAFSGFRSLTSVTIPDGIMLIGKSAFSGCARLMSITIPKSVTCIDIYTFERCSSLTSVMIPESVTSIKYKAFYGCPNLTIHGTAGSYAERFAKENNIPFIAK